jgi:hypothetical protein
LHGLAGGSDAARLLRQIVQSEVVRQNPAYAPTLATTVGSNGGQAAALSNPNSAGAWVAPTSCLCVPAEDPAL